MIERRKEEEKVYKALHWAMSKVGEELEKRFDYTPILPLDVEAEIGPNWMTTEVVEY